MELMEKFEVAFALEQPEAAAGQPKEPQRWLIPELLPEVQPAAFAEFRQPGVKRLRFSYPRGAAAGAVAAANRAHARTERGARGVALAFGRGAGVGRRAGAGAAGSQ
jgi:hypothetical protein